MVEWEVIKQWSVQVTALLYLFFLLMYSHKIVSQKFWTACGAQFEKQTSAFGLGLGLAFRVRVLF